MFTGLVEEIGIVESITGNQEACRLRIRAQKVLEGVSIGDSISVNGICLTVTSFSLRHFEVDVMPETLRHTSLRQLQRGQKVNLERAMKLGDRFGGHLVSGHVDGTGTILSLQLHANAVRFRIEATAELLRYIIPRGSICIDGISLTVVDVNESSFSVSIIPHTLASTSLQDRKPGDRVNLEADMIGKYVERLLLHPRNEQKADKPQMASQSRLNLSFLQENGFA
ncbi:MULTISPECIES: riboflavin synthase [Brevibacillus]|uniref:Riboflavin synthase n=1 Tax=Brevibacillus invocatus TaxID=173959 RepID=A0A3M8CIS8_9BACL|nr:MULTISPECIES: riboflavin synthase [Brevibacillus]MDH4616104.1 riboflavin synthase [Brevibacillus sp. AY1]RNB75267.1 riboflavin synthase [Brevibacillus invocatus]